MMPHGDQIREVDNHNSTKKTTVRDVRCRVGTVRERQKKKNLYLNSRTSEPCFFYVGIRERKKKGKEGIIMKI